MSDTNPVSVLMSTYNRASLISESIESVLNQSYENFELIIVDDGSTDDTEKWVRSFSDERIKYNYIEHTGNISTVRNKCLEYSSHDLIAFIDSDDLWDAQKLRLQVEAMVNYPELGFVLTNAIEFNDQRTLRSGIYSEAILHKYLRPEFVFEDAILFKLIFYPSAILFRKCCFNVAGHFDESYSISETHLIVQVAQTFPMLIVPELLTLIRKHEGNASALNMSANVLELQGLMKYLLDSDSIDEELYKKATFKYSYNTAMEELLFGNVLFAQKRFKDCIRQKPLSLKSWMRFVQSNLRFIAKYNPFI